MSDTLARLVASAGEQHLVLTGGFSLQDVSDVLTLARTAAEGSGNVVVELQDAGHLHLGCVQVLVALRRELEQRGRSFRVEGTSEAAARALNLAGLPWLKEGL
jgi:anti-anti-sigma regulatory factor